MSGAALSAALFSIAFSITMKTQIAIRPGIGYTECDSAEPFGMVL